MYQSALSFFYIETLVNPALLPVISTWAFPTLEGMKPSRVSQNNFSAFNLRSKFHLVMTIPSTIKFFFFSPTACSKTSSAKTRPPYHINCCSLFLYIYLLMSGSISTRRTVREAGDQQEREWGDREREQPGFEMGKREMGELISNWGYNWVFILKLSV